MEWLLRTSNFIKDNPIAAPVGTLGWALIVLAYLNDAYSFVTAGLPNGVWAAIGASVFALAMFSVVAKQHRVLQRTISSVPTGGGPDPQQVAPTRSAVPWNNEAHLMLVFDKAMKNAKAITQENVPYYYWRTLHEMEIVLDTAKFTATPCGVIVFLSFQDRDSHQL